jgi:uncharacterized protein
VFSSFGLATARSSDCYHWRVPAPTTLVFLIAVFFATSLLSVLTGSTSLITVPVMISVGIEPHVAIATNMLALTFMSVGGSLPFMRNGVVSRKGLQISIAVTVVGSALGALLVLDVPIRALQVTIGVAMTAVAVFSILNKGMGVGNREAPSSWPRALAGFALTFVLAIYGGFFSGGYVTMLTAVFVTLFGMTFLQAVATTKFVNVFSSGVATLVFLWRGAVDLKLGLILGISMFLGALLGGRIALFLSAKWLRRIFVVTVLGLAAKMLLAGI